MEDEDQQARGRFRCALNAHHSKKSAQPKINFLPGKGVHTKTTGDDHNRKESVARAPCIRKHRALLVVHTARRGRVGPQSKQG